MAEPLIENSHCPASGSKKYTGGRGRPARPEIALVSISLLLLLAGTFGLRKGSGAEWKVTATPEQQSALERITADSLRDQLSYIAADALEGRATPSQGQDLAAEYIAEHFRRSGLEPAGNIGFFQTAPEPAICPNPVGFRFLLTVKDQDFEIPAANFRMNSVRALEINQAPLVRIPFGWSGKRPDLTGKVIITELPSPSADGGNRDGTVFQVYDFIRRWTRSSPLLLVFVDRHNRQDVDYFSSSALDVREENVPGKARFPIVILSGEAGSQAFDALSAEPGGSSVSVHLAQPVRKTVTLRNVAGLLRGSDPLLGNSYLLVTAHYDGTGPTLGLDFKGVWNAANDDGSGTVSVVEIASALASLSVRPLRSIVFMVFFGEEKGLLGSAYYARHPLYPIKSTIAAINLEQLGRTDSIVGNQSNRATLTGYDYSEIPRVFKQAGKSYGITVYKDEVASDEYFARSDNQSLAELGIPAHTLCVAFDFPDYHGAGDEWEKINYENMERTVRMTALAILTLAESEHPPLWNNSNQRAQPYLRAWKALQGERTD